MKVCTLFVVSVTLQNDWSKCTLYQLDRKRLIQFARYGSASPSTSYSISSRRSKHSTHSVTSSGTSCLDIAGNIVTTNPNGNIDIAIGNGAGSTFIVEQTTGTTNPLNDIIPNNELVETDIQAAQANTVDVGIAPFFGGTFIPGTCNDPFTP